MNRILNDFIRNPKFINLKKIKTSTNQSEVDQKVRKVSSGYCLNDVTL